MRMNGGLDVFFPSAAGCIKSIAPVQTYKSITSISGEFGNKGLRSFILGAEIKIDHSRHKGTDLSITAQCG